MPETLTCPHCQNSITTTKTAELSPQTRINCKHCGKPYSIAEGRATSPTPVFDPVESDGAEYRPHRERLGFWLFVGLMNSLSALMIVCSPIAILVQWGEEVASSGPWLTLIGGFLLGGVAMALEMLSDIEQNTRR